MLENDCSKPSPYVYNMACSYYLTNEEVLSFEKLAEGGDINAVHRLREYCIYNYQNIEKCFMYVETGANLNDASSQYNLAFFLGGYDRKYENYYDIDKAIYWAQKANDNGAMHAKSLLKLLYKKKQQEQQGE